MKKSVFRVLSGLLLTALLLGACGPAATGGEVTQPPEQPTQAPPEPTTPLTKVRLGISPFQDCLLPMIGIEKGWYAEEGLDVQPVILGWTEVQEALAADEVDIAWNNISSVVATHEKWPQFVYVYGVNIFDGGAALMGRPTFKTADEFEKEGMTRADAVHAAILQLKGKTVVTTGNTDMGQAVLGAAYRNGLDLTKDFEVVDLNPDEGLAAFLSGTGDFYLGGIPQRTRAVKEGMKVIAQGAELAPPPLNGLVTSKDYAAANQDVILKMIHVWFRIINYVELNPDEGGGIVLKVLNEQTGANMTIDDFKAFWQVLEHYPLSASLVQQDILDPSGYSYWRNRFDDCNWYFYEVSKTIKAPVKAEDAMMLDQFQKLYVDKYGLD